MSDEGERPAKGERWVRMYDLFGLSVIPPESAKVVARALNIMVATGDCPRNARWQAVELWAADYLAGYEAHKALLRAAADPNFEHPVSDQRPPDDQARRR